MSDFMNFESHSLGQESLPLEEADPLSSLTIDDSLSIPERIEKYINSEITLHRIYLIRSLTEYARQLSYEDIIKIIIPLLENLVHDSDVTMKLVLVEQIPDLVSYLLTLGNEQTYTEVTHRLLPILAQLTTDRNHRVRFSAGDSLIEIGRKIHSEDFFTCVLPIIKSLANDNTEEDHRVQAAQMLCDTPALLGDELCQQYILPLVIKLVDDPSFRVRKAIVMSLGEVGKVVGDLITTSFLVPLFIKLSQDDIWGVRKSCVDVIVSLGEAIEQPKRYTTLFGIFEKFLQDQSKWVRSSAYKCLGPFIAMLPSTEVSSSLLKHFGLMATQAKIIGDNELPMHCAFNFPGVLLTIGGTRWSELKELYFMLAKDVQWKVRKTLAHSIHEVSKILGTELTESNLLEVLDLFLKDIDEVKIAVIPHMASILVVISPSSRSRYLPVLQNLQRSRIWRFRRALAKQLAALQCLFPLVIVEQVFFPLALLLCQDEYAEVRRIACKQLSSLFDRLKAEQSLETVDQMESQMLSLATHHSCLKRQLFLQICSNLIPQLYSEPQHFESKYFALFSNLSQDRVPNIRMDVASVLGKVLRFDRYRHNVQILTLLDNLRNDKDVDVRNLAKAALELQLLSSIDTGVSNGNREKNENGEIEDSTHIVSNCEHKENEVEEDNNNDVDNDEDDEDKAIHNRFLSENFNSIRIDENFMMERNDLNENLKFNCEENDIQPLKSSFETVTTNEIGSCNHSNSDPPPTSTAEQFI